MTVSLIARQYPESGHGKEAAIKTLKKREDMKNKIKTKGFPDGSLQKLNSG